MNNRMVQVYPCRGINNTPHPLNMSNTVSVQHLSLLFRRERKKAFILSGSYSNSITTSNVDYTTRHSVALYCVLWAFRILVFTCTHAHVDCAVVLKYRPKFMHYAMLNLRIWWWWWWWKFCCVPLMSGNFRHCYLTLLYVTYRVGQKKVGLILYVVAITLSTAGVVNRNFWHIYSTPMTQSCNWRIYI